MTQAGQMDIRKFHKKSRTGCARCKRRRIKCDEQKPSCRNCEKHQLQCSLEFLTPLTCPSRQSINAVIRPKQDGNAIYIQTTTRTKLSLPTQYSLGYSLPVSSLGLQTQELLHHYHTALYDSLGDRCPRIIWNDTIPRLSHNYPFVLPAILAISALHLASLIPARKSQLQLLSLTHESSALPSFRALMGSLKPSPPPPLLHSQALHSDHNSHAITSSHSDHATSNPAPLLHLSPTSTHAYTPDTPVPLATPTLRRTPHIHALFACASHIAYFVIAAPTPPGIDRCRIPSKHDTYPHWFQSMRGFMALLDNHWLELADGPLGATISRERIPELYAVDHPDDAHLTGLLGMFDLKDDEVDVEYAGEERRREREAENICREAISYLRRVFAVTHLPYPNARLAGRTWAGTVSQEYAELVYERNPAALVILASYCVLLKRIDDVWYMRGLGSGLLANVVIELGERGGKWWPWLEWAVEQPVATS